MDLHDSTLTVICDEAGLSDLEKEAFSKYLRSQGVAGDNEDQLREAIAEWQVIRKG